MRLVLANDFCIFQICRFQITVTFRNSCFYKLLLAKDHWWGFNFWNANLFMNISLYRKSRYLFIQSNIKIMYISTKKSLFVFQHVADCNYWWTFGPQGPRLANSQVDSYCWKNIEIAWVNKRFQLYFLGGLLPYPFWHQLLLHYFGTAFHFFYNTLFSLGSSLRVHLLKFAYEPYSKLNSILKWCI